MAKMTKNQLIDAIAEGTQVSKEDVKAVIEQMATVGYKELNESGERVPCSTTSRFGEAFRKKA